MGNVAVMAETTRDRKSETLEAYAVFVTIGRRTYIKDLNLGNVSNGSQLARAHRGRQLIEQEHAEPTGGSRGASIHSRPPS